MPTLNVLANQEFLPTNVRVEFDLAQYILPACLVLISIFIMFLGRKGGSISTKRGFVNALLTGIGAFGLLYGSYIILTGLMDNDTFDLGVNNRNASENIREVYDVDSVSFTRLAQQGDMVTIETNGHEYQAFYEWDPDTFEPTLSPIVLSVDDFEELKR